MVAYSLDVAGGEAVAGGGAPALAVEDAGDDAVGMVGGQAADEIDRILVGLARCRPGARQRDRQGHDLTATPADGQDRPVFGPFHGDGHVLQQGAQQFLAVAVGRGRRRPDGGQVAAEGQERGAFGIAQACRPLPVAALQVRFGFGQRAQ
ncbi:MAG: hypothetical protein HQL42_20860, partial [Alphaproteobacteria bacterium]|nr:hypothetical protein [Alphaproteobacteria bacterium]